MENSRWRCIYNLIFVLLIAPWIVQGCKTTNSEAASDDAAKVERGRLKFAKGLNSLRVGDRYVFRDVSQSFFLNGKPWAPPGDEKLADRINWCDTSPNPDVEILRCFSDSSESYRYTYIIRMKGDKPEVKRIDEALGSVWIDAEGRWLLFRKFFANIETDEQIPVKGMPFADDESGSAPVTYVLAVSPDKKTVVASYQLSPDKLWIIDTESGIKEIRAVSYAKYPWLKDHENPSKDIQPPPAPSKHFVWKKDAHGKDVMAVPELGPIFVPKPRPA